MQSEMHVLLFQMSNIRIWISTHISDSLSASIVIV